MSWNFAMRASGCSVTPLPRWLCCSAPIVGSSLRYSSLQHGHHEPPGSWGSGGWAWLAGGPAGPRGRRRLVVAAEPRLGPFERGLGPRQVGRLVHQPLRLEPMLLRAID